jgi:hypothetical protein
MGGLDATMKVSCFDRDRSSSDELIGHFETTLREVLSGHFSTALINPYKKRYFSSLSCSFNFLLTLLFFFFVGLDIRAQEVSACLQSPSTSPFLYHSRTLSMSPLNLTGRKRNVQVHFFYSFPLLLFLIQLLVAPIRIESRPPGSSEFVVVAYAPPTTCTATIRMEDVRTPYHTEIAYIISIILFDFFSWLILY